jgi:hypothetical protein
MDDSCCATALLVYRSLYQQIDYPDSTIARALPSKAAASRTGFPVFADLDVLMTIQAICPGCRFINDYLGTGQYGL